MATQMAPLTVPDIINKVWALESQAYTDGEVKSIKIPVPLKPIIGQHGINEITKRFSHLVNSDDVVVAQGNGVIKISKADDKGFDDAKSDGSSTAHTVEGSTAKQNKIPRPPNAFILYRQRNHPNLKSKHPTLSNNEISIILGKQWKNEDQSVKEYYFDAAQSLKEKHLKEHPEYAYQPRKTGDKKRRMTPRKVERLNSIASTLLQTQLRNSDPTPVTVPDFSVSDNGDLEFTLGDDDVSPDTFQDMLHSADISNMMSYANAQAQMHGANVPEAIRNALTQGGYPDTGMSVSEAISQHHYPLATRPIHEVLQSNLNDMDPSRRTNPIVSFEADPQSKDAGLFFEYAFNHPANQGELFPDASEMKTFMDDKSQFVGTNCFDANADRKRLERILTEYSRQ